MKLMNVKWRVCFIVAALLVLGYACFSPALCGSLRITMKDGTSVEVPYYWEMNGEIKFDVAGGVVGVPKSQVASVQEILEAKEFDPEVLFQPSADLGKSDQTRMLAELVQTKAPSAKCEVSDPEENAKMLREAAETRRTSSRQGELVHAQKYKVEQNFPAMCLTPEGNMLVMQNIMSSRTDLTNRDFTLTLYDGDGKVLQKKRCELHEIEVDPATLKKLQIKGRLYLVKAEIKPDSKIKRYEITAAQY